MNLHTFLGLLRHVLTFGGGYLVATGKMSEPDVQEWVGIILSIAGALWSAWDKYRHRPISPPATASPAPASDR